jgi:hypothetical protein
VLPQGNDVVYSWHPSILCWPYGKKTVDFWRKSSNKERNDVSLTGDASRLLICGNTRFGVISVMSER